MLVDSHAHLDSPDFDSDLDEVLQRAKEAQVTRILTIGCMGETVETVSKVLNLIETHKQIFAAVGVHPHDARFFNDGIAEQILKLMTHPGVLGWGEIGLDFYYDNSPRDEQRAAFRKQLQLAREAKKPVIIHSRDAEEETCQILEEEFSGGPGGVLHCFTHSLETAQRCLPLGFYVSFGGILTFPKAHNLREIVRTFPLNRVLIETDSPYLAPAPFRGKRNEPAYVLKVAEKLAEVRGLTLAEVASQTTANFDRLFL